MLSSASHSSWGALHCLRSLLEEFMFTVVVYMKFGGFCEDSLPLLHLEIYMR